MKVAEKTKTNSENKLNELFVLWKHTSKEGLEYLSGYTTDESKTKLVGFFNSTKKNPDEPDIRVYQEVGTELHEVTSLWSNLSKNDGEYFKGKDNENKKVVGFINPTNDEKRPYLRVYQD